MLFSFSRSLVAVCCIAIASVQSSAPTQKSITSGPANAAFIYGEDHTLNCEASSPEARVLWTEFTVDQNGRQISDGDYVFQGHPESARYTIIHPNGSSVYDLAIESTVLADGGTYQCADVIDVSVPANADIITLDGFPNCTTNIPQNGRVREDVYYTIECIIGYKGTVAPTMTWSGPDPETTSNWNQATTVTSTSVWSGINMNMSRYFDAQTFSLLTNFTQSGFNKENFASNVPDWNSTFSTEQLYVEWTPQRMYIVPEKISYEIDDTVECLADSNPSSEYYWRFLDTQEVINGPILTATEALAGSTWRMQCRATNVINGIEYVNDFFFDFIVNERTTTPTTTPPTTTTPPPAEAPCDDLTGRWTATSPWLIDMCIEVDNNRNGRVIGLVRNSTDPYFIEVRGRVSPNKYDQIGMAGTWPVNIGTMAFNGICNKCYGVEKLQMTAIARKPLDNPTCEDQGPVYSYADYAFSRTGPPCRDVFKQYNIQL